MIETECFKDINDSENEEAQNLHQEDKIRHPGPAPKHKRGFFQRFFSGAVRPSLVPCFGAV